MKVVRVERKTIKKSNPMWKDVDVCCFRAKNVYNIANYIVRQEFINSGKWIRYYELDKIMREYPEYYELGSQASKNTLILLDKNWKSFFAGIKDWSKKKGDGYLGKPGLPKYKEKNGRSIFMLSNIQFKVKDDMLRFSWTPFHKYNGIFKTRLTGRPLQLRFIPQGNCYVMEIVYETNILDPLNQNNSIIGIDLGVDNFATISNNIGLPSIIINGRIIKSMNQYYNKNKARIQSEAGMIWNNRLRNLLDKHNNKIDYTMHKISRMIINYCLTYGIDTIVVGKNDEWKQNVNLGKRNNQNFYYIPYENFITKLRYKCANYGINFIETEESYTSGTSFLDYEEPVKENYNKKRRIKRGLFKSNE